MAKLVWDQMGERLYETGVDRGVCFPMDDGVYDKGEAWNGLSGVTDSPSGAEVTKLYANNGTYASLMSVEELGLTIEAYTYPKGFLACDGMKEVYPGVFARQQTRKHFGFVYRSLVGNDTDGNDHGYKINIVFDCLASPSETTHSTVNDSPDVNPLSWTVSTNTTEMEGVGKPLAAISITSTEVDAAKLKTLEDLIYGTAEAEPTMPTPADIVKIFGADSSSSGTTTG